MAIWTNKIAAQLNCAAIDERFDIYQVKKVGEGRLSYESRAFETYGQEDYILSLLGRAKDSCFYLLTPSGAVTLKELQTHYEELYSQPLEGEDFEPNDEGFSLRPEKIKAAQMDERDLVALLLNAIDAEEQRAHSSLAEISEEPSPLQNVTGHLYCFHPGLGKLSKQDRQEQIVALELFLEEGMLLCPYVRTFTRRDALKPGDFSKKKPAVKFARYVPNDMRTAVRRIQPGEKLTDKSVYLLKQHKGERTKGVNFLAYDSLDDFHKSKCGILREVMARFNAVFEGCAHIAFAEVDESRRLPTPEKLLQKRFDYYKKGKKGFLEDWFEGKAVFVVDVPKDEESADLCARVADLLADESLLGRQLQVVSESQAGAINLEIIHEKKWYEERKLEDPHDSPSCEGAICQHLTIEKVRERQADFVTMLRRCLMDAAIKEDVNRGRMTAFDWPGLGVDEPLTFVVFGEREKDEEGRPKPLSIAFFLKVFPDGALSFFRGSRWAGEGEATEWDAKTRTLIEACGGDRRWNSNIQGLVIDAEGRVNVIEKTKGFPVPALDLVLDEVCGIDWALPKADVFGVLSIVSGDPDVDAALKEMCEQVYELPKARVKSSELNQMVREACRSNGNLSARRLRDWIDKSFEDQCGLHLQTSVPRDKEAKETLLEPLVKVHCIRADDGTKDLLYWANRFGALDQSGVSKNAVIRRVHDLDGGEPFFADLLETLVVPIVRVNDSTVLPFPFKYLREWVEMQKLEERRVPGE